MRERVILAGLLIAVLLVAGCGGTSAGGGGSAEGEGSVKSCDPKNPPLFEEGQLTVATDKPAYPPWFKGDPQDYSGYEGDVASEVARRMNLPIKWVVEPFNKSYAPGAKDYDFDINQITITKERERVVDFSDGYFDNPQGVLAKKDSPVASATSISDLKDANFLDAGRILEQGPPAKIFTAPEHSRTARFLARIIEAGRL